MIWYIGQKRRGESFDTLRNHIVHCTKINDQIDLFRDKPLPVQKSADIFGEPTCIEFLPPQSKRKSESSVCQCCGNVGRSRNTSNRSKRNVIGGGTSEYLGGRSGVIPG